MPRSAAASKRSRSPYLALTILTIIAGLVLRRVPLGLPFAVVKFGGSILWAAMVYWILAAIRPASSSASLAINSALFTTMIELFKLYHVPLLDSFRRTLAGSLLLGRYFSWWDIVAYLGGITLTALADRRFIRYRA